jgi:hypothetical protein
MHSHNINGRLKVGIIAHMVEDIGHETHLGDLTDKLHPTRIDDLMFLVNRHSSGFSTVVVLISRIGPSGRPEQQKIAHRVERDGRTNPLTASRR